MWASACKHIFLLLYDLHSSNCSFAMLGASICEFLFWLLIPSILSFLASRETLSTGGSAKYVKRAKRAPPSYWINAYPVRLGAQAVSVAKSALLAVSTRLSMMFKCKKAKEQKRYPNQNRRKRSSRNFRLRSVSGKDFRSRFNHLKSELRANQDRINYLETVCNRRCHQCRESNSNNNLLLRIRKWMSTTKRNNNHHHAMLTSYEDRIRKMAVFDTDTFPIVVDSGCSRTLSSFKKDFIQSSFKPRTETRSVQGFAGSLSSIEATGTISWKITDDAGELRELIIPNCLYVPASNTRLLSPQHLAQDSTDNVTYVVRAKEAIITWESTNNNTNDSKYVSTKTMIIDKDAANIATMWAAHGLQQYKAFEARMTNSSESISMPHIDKGTLMELADQLREESYKIDVDTDYWKANLGTPLPDPFLDTYRDIKQPEDAKLLWHQRLGHISMERIDRLLNLGYLPAFLAKCPHPICQACIYGKMTRRPWRTKPTLDDEKSNTATAVGSTISVDQLESPILGFVAQLKGRLTKKRYRVATVFVDHHSDYLFVFLQQSTTSVETVQAKHAF